MFMFVLLLSLGYLFIVRAYPYNTVDVDFITDRKELSNYFSDDLSSKNMFLGVYTSECVDDFLDCHSCFASNRYGGHNIKVVMMSDDYFPVEIESCTLFFYRFGDHILSPSSSLRDLDNRNVLMWAKSVVTISFEIHNTLSIDVYLGSTDGNSVAKLGPKDKILLTSIYGTIVVFKTSTNPDTVFGYLEVDGLDFSIELSSTYRVCNLTDHYIRDLMSLNNDANAISRILSICEVWRSLFNLQLLQSGFTRRLSNFLQPKFVPPVSRSSLGFALTRLPEMIFAQLLGWYDEKINSQGVETFAGDVINQKDVSTYMAPLTQFEMDKLGFDLYPIMQDWYAGNETLIFSNTYGFRRYCNNSILKMHVDRVATHVVSGIINVAQKVNADWEIVILDHENIEHRVVMKPGDLLLYESAKAIHGRPDPLDGEYYDNLFIHYYPENWDYGWLQP